MCSWENDLKLHFGIFSASHEGNSDRSEDWFKGTSKPETMETTDSPGKRHVWRPGPKGVLLLASTDGPA